MNPNPVAVHKGGNRNIFCPYYRNCLDDAVKRNWQSWDCFECRHHLTRELTMVGPFIADNSLPYYSLSPDISLETEH